MLQRFNYSLSLFSSKVEYLRAVIFFLRPNFLKTANPTATMTTITPTTPRIIQIVLSLPESEEELLLVELLDPVTRLMISLTWITCPDDLINQKSVLK